MLNITQLCGYMTNSNITHKMVNYKFSDVKFIYKIGSF